MVIQWKRVSSYQICHPSDFSTSKYILFPLTEPSLIKTVVKIVCTALVFKPVFYVQKKHLKQFLAIVTKAQTGGSHEKSIGLILQRKILTHVSQNLQGI